METTIINGQPLNLGNRMVTWDGLNDFFNMLKNEIPRMGVNNSGVGPYLYLIGENNSVKNGASYSFLLGKENKLVYENTEVFIAGTNNQCECSQSIILGLSNIIKGDVNNYVIGAGNSTNDGSNIVLGDYNVVSDSTYVLGHWNVGGKTTGQDGKPIYHMLYNPGGYTFGSTNIISFTAGNKEDETLSIQGNGYILGSYNNIKGVGGKTIYALGSHLMADSAATTIDDLKPLYLLGRYNENSPNSALVIGDGTTDASSNLLVIGYDGEFRLKNGYFSEDITFGSQASFGDLVTFADDIECESAATFSNIATFNGDLKIYNKSINIIQATEDKDENGEITNIREDSVAKFAPNGTTFSHQVSFKDLNTVVIYGDGYPILTDEDIKNGRHPADSSYTKKIYWNNIRLIDGDNGNDSLNMLFYNHGFRNILHPCNTNEAIWTTDNSYALHINQRKNYRSEDSTVPDYMIPNQIHFHAGQPDNWAGIHCGAIDCGIVDCSGVDSSGQIKCKNVTCNVFSMDEQIFKQEENYTYTLNSFQLPQGLLLIQVGVWHNLTKLGNGAMCMYHYGDAFGLGTQLSAQTNNSNTNFSFYCKDLNRIMYCSARMQWTSENVTLSIQLDSATGTDTDIQAKNIKFHCTFTPLLTANGVLES